MIFCHHLCGNLGSLKRNGDSTRALQSSTSLFVAFITGPRWNIYKTLFASLLKTSKGNNWLQTDATVLSQFASFGSSQQGGMEEEMPEVLLCTPPGEDQPQGQTRASKSKRFLAEFWVQQELASEFQRWGTVSSKQAQNHTWNCRTAVSLHSLADLPCSAFMVLYPLSSLGDLHLCLSIQRLNVIYTSLLSSWHVSSSSFYS